jgi:tRNA(His) 5'-end guanylyltransferase
MKNDDFGDRMKLYEGAEAHRKFMPLLPICVRLDGRGFSKFTRGFERPYDQRMRDAMVATTTHLVKATNACLGYTQSDEISLVIYSDSMKSQTFFDGRIQKLVSVLSAMATARFMKEMFERFSVERMSMLPLFDCRAWNVPNLVEAANSFLWREIDATKNSISMAASCYYSHKELTGKTGPEKQEMLWQKGVNWNDYPAFFKRGVFVQRKTTSRVFTSDEVDRLPAKHAARTNPNLVVERSDVRVVDMPSFSTVKNRVLVVFNGADPIVEG